MLPSKIIRLRLASPTGVLLGTLLVSPSSMYRRDDAAPRIANKTSSLRSNPRSSLPSTCGPLPSRCSLPPSVWCSWSTEIVLLHPRSPSPLRWAVVFDRVLCRRFDHRLLVFLDISFRWGRPSRAFFTILHPPAQHMCFFLTFPMPALSWGGSVTVHNSRDHLERSRSRDRLAPQV